MNLRCRLTNELPFLLEIPNGRYDVKVELNTVSLEVNSDCYTLHTARFPENAGKTYYVAEKSELIGIIDHQHLGNYAFANCMTFVVCDFEKNIELSQETIGSVSDEDCIELIKTRLVSSNTTSSDLNSKAQSIFDNMDGDSVVLLKKDSFIKKHLYSLAKDQLYYLALNRLIREYSYLRGHFWVYALDENILNGTLQHFYVDGKLVDSITRAGFVPSILPYKRKYPEISDEEKTTLLNRLSIDNAIPIEDELLLVSKNLWFRRQYRSAVIECSAALEIVVENKIREKMQLQRKTQLEIDTELEKTETNFRQRCDHYLKKYTQKSFEVDNVTLWNKIDEHRKIYRHKIAHSDMTPDFFVTEQIIKDFEEAIRWVNAL